MNTGHFRRHIVRLKLKGGGAIFPGGTPWEGMNNEVPMNKRDYEPKEMCERFWTLPLLAVSPDHADLRHTNLVIYPGERTNGIPPLLIVISEQDDCLRCLDRQACVSASKLSVFPSPNALNHYTLPQCPCDANSGKSMMPIRLVTGSIGGSHEAPSIQELRNGMERQASRQSIPRKVLIL